MKPQDVLVIIKLHLWKDAKWTVKGIADSIGLSVSETHAAIKRCEKSGLLDILTKRPVRANLEELLIHGVKYAFPAELGKAERGMPTAYSAPPINKMIKFTKNDLVVWPFAQGRARGAGISPLYPSVPKACEKDKELYAYLALIDCLRIGRVREKKLATEELIKKIRALPS